MFLPKTGTPLSEKGVRIIKSWKVVTKAMFPSAVYGFDKASDAPVDYEFWRSKLPESDRLRESIVVVPTIGIVAPINDMNWSGYTHGSEDYQSIISGKSVSINEYLKSGVLHYPQTAKAGSVGNMVIFGHSSYFNYDVGRYKTVFANLMELDKDEEIWVYTRDPLTKNIRRYSYIVTASYNTKPEDTTILLQGDEKSKITLFTCTPVGGIEGRWVIQGELIHEDNESCHSMTTSDTLETGVWKNGKCIQRIIKNSINQL